MHKIIYIPVLLLLIVSSAAAQEKKFVYRDSSLIQDGQPVEIPDEYQSIEVVPLEDQAAAKESYSNEPLDTTLSLNNLDTPVDSINRWKNIKAFEYAKNLDSLLKEKKNKETRKAASDNGPGLLDRFFSSAFLKITLWTLAIFFILFIMYRLFLAEGVFKREPKPARADLPEIEEQIISGETDFDALIKLAVQNDNYRQAVRYQYLRILHRLADKNLIELAPDKTNYQYVREIRNPGFQNDFASLTLNYEYVWYGEFDIDKNIYQKLETGFTGFNQKI